MDRTGILGGTFNPIHNGHIRIALKAAQVFGLKEVLIIPSGISYFKKGQDIPEGSVRFEMCALACENEPCLRVSDIEVNRPGNSYTCDTLKLLKKKKPDTELIYILGADSLAEVKSFKDPQQIFDLCKMAVSVRGGIDRRELEGIISDYRSLFGADIRLFCTTNIDISSSMIRNRVRDGEDISDLVPEAVGRYIKEKGLYQN